MAIEEACISALSEREIKPRLLIEIKNFIENLRSTLDFTARGLFAEYGSTTISNPRIYFPYAPINQSEEKFQRSQRIDYCIPGLSTTRPDILTKLEPYQHSASSENKWLPDHRVSSNQ